MTTPTEPLVITTRRGLYCPAGDFYIDPAKPVQTAVVTHAHGDHLREGSARIILAAPGLGIVKKRMKDARTVTPVDYDTRMTLGPVTVSLHPAGHILGSAQVRLEHGGQVWVVSGDYKRQPDPTCASFTPVPCDTFISESTFARPHYVWPDTRQVAREIVDWWQDNRERGLASVLFCYALGKAQRVLAEMRAHTDETVYVHGETAGLVEVYRRAGIDMLPTQALPRDTTQDLRGALVLVAPTQARTSWLRRLGPQARGFCSGWMLLAGEAQRRGYDRGFVISDHADWPGLVQSCEQSGAPRVLLMHGEGSQLAAHLQARGIDAGPLPGQTAGS